MQGNEWRVENRVERQLVRHCRNPRWGGEELSGRWWKPVRQLQFPSVQNGKPDGCHREKDRKRSNKPSSACLAGAEAGRQLTMLLV